MDAGSWILLLLVAAIFARAFLLPSSGMREEPAFQPLHDDPDLGEVSYAKQDRCLMAQPYVGGVRIAVLLLDTPSPPRGLQLVREIRARLDALVLEARMAAVRDLLVLANGEWRRKGETERDAAAFAALQLEGVIAAPDRALSLVFYDGGLFLGRRVRVLGHLDGGVFSARVVG